MSEKLIYGIQQIGVGVDDADKAFEWYATRLGSDVMVFDDSNTATYMAPYMGGQHREKRAILAMNMQGGSGYELWQHTGRTPLKASPELRIGDLGINIAKVKSRNIQQSFDRLRAQNVTMLSGITAAPDGRKSFFISDPFGNILQIMELNSWYAASGKDVGGQFGAIIGVSDIDKSMSLYADILGYKNVVYDKSGRFDDLDLLPGGREDFRRVLLAHDNNRVGGFSKLFGDSQIELVQRRSPTLPRRLFEGRFWGDIGYIHLCFDIHNMTDLVAECAEKGYPFTVLSQPDFNMGDANGHWGYLEDNDGTLIEFVQTHKVPLIKKLGLNINLTNRDPNKPLPNWLIKAMAIKRVKF